MRNLRSLICILAVAMYSSLNASAQEIAGSIRGTVQDASGAIVSGAKVTAVQTETGLERTVTTDSLGAYVFVELPIGHYRLEAEAKGFKKYIQQGISLGVNQTATVTVRLEIGTAAQEVRVQANAPLVETTVTSLGKTVGARDVLDLPLNGRDFTQLGLLQPGVFPITPGLAVAGGSLRSGQAYAVNGQRPESNNFLIDGANNFNAVDGGLVIHLPIDAIAEFHILTHTASAEFGHSTGSTTNIITRSGTNAFHGAAWEFLRNDALDAKSFFASSVEPLKRNQFGGTFGGPIKKDKAFFFGYYEGLRNRQGETVSATVPTQTEQQGDFGLLCTQAGGSFNSSGICSAPAGQLVNEFSNQPFAFNKLPGIDPLSHTLAAFFPLPNQPSLGPNAYSTTQTLMQNNDQFGLRVDHYLTSRDVLNFRYMFSQGDTTDPLSTAGANVPGFPVGEGQRAQNIVGQETHTFSPMLIGVARFSFLRNKYLFNEAVNHTTLSSLGFQYAPSLDAAIGPPFIQVSGYASVGDPITGPRDTYENALDISGSLTWIHGRHEMKFGGGYSHDQVNVLFGIASNGFFVFAPVPANDAFASFLLGAPVFFLQGGGDPSRGLRGNNLNFYAQDTYKITPHLTLNAGLRYELPFPYTEIRNRTNLFEPGVQSVVFPSAPAGLVYPGDPGVPGGLIPAEKTAFAPRVGLAWDPRGNARWLVTASYGIFYDPYYNGQGGPLQAPVSAPPYLQTPQLNFPNFADPFNGANPFNGTFAEPMTLLTLAPNLRLPYAQDWNLNIQRSLGGDWLFEAGYVGTKGTKLPRFIEGNPAVFVPGETNGVPNSTEENVNQRRLYSGCTLAQPSPCNFASVGLIAGTANSTYNALQTSLKKRFSHGLSFLASYTFSKTLDDVSSFNITGSASQSVAGENDLAQNPFNLTAEHGRSMFDARHRFVLSYEWELPFWNHPGNWYQHVLGDWQLNGITTFMSGTPFTVYDSQDVSLQGGAPEISGFSSNRPDLVGNPNSGPHTPQEWFNVSAFQRLNPATQAGQFGNEGRNVVQGPGLQQWDFSAFKNIPIRESKSLQFRAEFFNVFNHANFRLPNNDISSPNFGVISEALPGRLVQLALKFLF
ncbi:MAG: carboxypeptidase regulatory-like domain-containing protein [Candidatus Acidiferrum sp.]